MDNVTLLRIVPLLLAVCCMAVLYFTPYIIGRRKPNAGTILLLNLLTGWTVVGWFVALYLAVRTEQPRSLASR